MTSALPCHKHHLNERDQALYIDQETIARSHPLHSGGEKNYPAYNAAMILVGERHAKGDLVDLVGHLIATIETQKRACLAGMDAAKRTSTIQLELAEKARAESSPEALASERAANAILTEENAALAVDAARYRFLRDDEYWQQSDRYWEAITAGGEKLDKTVDEG
ncbi:MAG TPA: hypothetical protein VF534_01755, partial [Paraburkholderia sp.]